MKDLCLMFASHFFDSSKQLRRGVFQEDFCLIFNPNEFFQGTFADHASPSQDAYAVANFLHLS